MPGASRGTSHSAKSRPDGSVSERGVEDEEWGFDDQWRIWDWGFGHEGEAWETFEIFFRYHISFKQLRKQHSSVFSPM